ncbi:F0F1 ATP synthase subunit gamma [Magnetofaba australis]|uniref:ATP synthase gamma chain n=1 Tax=Magnetofaba australis IT-1 TaxID=1434232 RepID=A0A1Y2K162_9PROT|nr:F0F1 ATP synthase subunit gamma [Magnetofaba australis]OSM00031.1 putative ATP synthase F1 subunit gamma [Magnetofaba australis IT-1]
MANMKALRGRIKSVTNTRQITKAMKMVSAAKLRRATDRAVQSRAYSSRMNRMVSSLAPSMLDNPGAPTLLIGRPGEHKRIELVVFTADRGLCGSFNSGIIRSTRERIARLQAEGLQVSLTCVGRKGHDVLKRQYGKLIRKVHTDVSRHMTFEYLEKEVGRELVKAFNEDKFDACYIVFNTFKSAMSQELTWRQLIPAPVDQPEEGAETEAAASYMYEPEEEEILEAILPRNLSMQIYQAQAESEASEHGARMTAMDSASRNANEMIRKLRIKFNRTRQAAITTELMEIIGGAESLKN